MNDKIAALALAKSFDRLSEDEKSRVLEVMTETEYATLTTVLRMAPRLDAAVTPSPQLLETLMAGFNAPLAVPTGGIKPWYNRSVPIWQAAAAFALVLAATLFFRASPVPSAHIVENQVQTDTVFIDKIVWKDKVVVRKVVVKQPSATIPPASIDPDTLNGVVDPSPSVSGSSIGAQPELLQFFTRVGER